MLAPLHQVCNGAHSQRSAASTLALACGPGACTASLRISWVYQRRPWLHMHAACTRAHSSPTTDFVSPLCGFSLALFCNYHRLLESRAPRICDYVSAYRVLCECMRICNQPAIAILTHAQTQHSALSRLSLFGNHLLGHRYYSVLILP